MCFLYQSIIFPCFWLFGYPFRSSLPSPHHDPPAQLWWKLDLIVPGGYPSGRFKGPSKSPHYIDMAVKSSVSHPHLGQRDTESTAGCGLVSILHDRGLQPSVLYCSPARKGQNSMGKQSAKPSSTVFCTHTLTKDSQIHTGRDYKTLTCSSDAIGLCLLPACTLMLSLCQSVRGWCRLLVGLRAHPEKPVKNTSGSYSSPSNQKDERNQISLENVFLEITFRRDVFWQLSILIIITVMRNNLVLITVMFNKFFQKVVKHLSNMWLIVLLPFNLCKYDNI